MGRRSVLLLGLLLMLVSATAAFAQFPTPDPVTEVTMLDAVNAGIVIPQSLGIIGVIAAAVLLPFGVYIYRKFGRPRGG